MKPSERIPVIKKIAARMAETPLDENVLVLRQFGLQPEYYVDEKDVLDPFSGSVAAIQAASDDVLLGLHEYFFGQEAPSPHRMSEQAVEGVWEADKLRLFVSHTGQHKATVGGLKLGLAARGVDAFVAHDDIEPTREWQGVIETALATCDALLAWLTPDFPESRWTDQEVGFAVGRSILVIPIRLDLDPYGFIGKYQGLQGSGKALHVVTDEVVDLLAASELTASRMIAPSARAFALSGSYESTRRLFRTLTKLPLTGWTDESLNLIEAAALENNQISDAAYDRQRVPDLLVPFIAERRAHV